MPQSSLAIILGDVTVRQHDGLFSLNDLHRASGGEDRHQPAKFVRLDQTEALIAEIGSSPEMESLKTIVGKGKAQGTYACRELVIAYAAWINAAFHLKVIRVFLAVTAPQPAPYTVQPGDTLNEAQQTALRALLESNVKRLPQEKQAAAMVGGWSKLKAHFGVPYRQIPASEFTESLSIIARHVSQWELLDAPQQTQPAIDPFNAQAMAAASKQANEYFDAARQGKYLQQPTAFPPEVLCGLLAQAMLNQRFMLSFDRHTGRMNLNTVPGDAFVLSWQQFARAVVTNDIDPSNAELADLASACNRRLAQRLAA